LQRHSVCGQFFGACSRNGKKKQPASRRIIGTGTGVNPSFA
jgi:hypothetical protein